MFLKISHICCQRPVQVFKLWYEYSLFLHFLFCFSVFSFLSDRFLSHSDKNPGLHCSSSANLLLLKYSSKVPRLTLNWVLCLFGTNHHGQRVEELVSQACVIFPPQVGLGRSREGWKLRIRFNPHKQQVDRARWMVYQWKMPMILIQPCHLLYCLDVARPLREKNPTKNTYLTG